MADPENNIFEALVDKRISFLEKDLQKVLQVRTICYGNPSEDLGKFKAPRLRVNFNLDSYFNIVKCST